MNFYPTYIIKAIKSTLAELFSEPKQLDAHLINKILVEDRLWLWSSQVA
jgi:hypothetical protein